MKIIDTFIFNDELDLLNVRLEMLYDVVDYFILVESDENFKGNRKPLYYTENKNNFSKYNDKIIVITNNSLKFKSIEHNEGSFKRENFSRDIIKESLINLNLDENDIVLHSDLDEIPNPKFLILVKNNIYNFTILSIQMTVLHLKADRFICQVHCHKAFDRARMQYVLQQQVFFRRQQDLANILKRLADLQQTI